VFHFPACAEYPSQPVASGQAAAPVNELFTESAAQADSYAQARLITHEKRSEIFGDTI